MVDFKAFHASLATQRSAQLGVDKRLFKPVPDAEPAQYVGISGHLQSAIEVAVLAIVNNAGGKGQERHGTGVNFVDQPIMTIPRTEGVLGLGALHYQIEKKQQEALRMFLRGEVDKAVFEVEGSLVYTCALLMLMAELREGLVASGLPAPKPVHVAPMSDKEYLMTLGDKKPLTTHKADVDKINVDGLAPGKPDLSAKGNADD